MSGVEADGSFAIDDIPSGTYTFSFELNEAGNNWKPLLGRLKFMFEVQGDDQQRGFIDLGYLQVE